MPGLQPLLHNAGPHVFWAAISPSQFLPTLPVERDVPFVSSPWNLLHHFSVLEPTIWRSQTDFTGPSNPL